MSVSESDAEPLTLPGTPGPSLRALWESLDPATKAALLPHLVGQTSADWLSETLWVGEGHSLSASSIRTYRRSLQ